MRRVKFISGLKIEERPLLDTDEVKYGLYGDYMEAPTEDGMLDVGKAVTEMVVPVHRLSCVTNGTRKDTYIAYSSEVQDFLETPFDALKEANEMLERQLSDARNRVDSICGAGLGRRLRFLFTRKI